MSSNVDIVVTEKSTQKRPKINIVCIRGRDIHCTCTLSRLVCEYESEHGKAETKSKAD